jgi:hypothetical protein
MVRARTMSSIWCNFAKHVVLILLRIGIHSTLIYGLLTLFQSIWDSSSLIFPKSAPLKWRGIQNPAKMVPRGPSPLTVISLLYALCLILSLFTDVPNLDSGPEFSE